MEVESSEASEARFASYVEALGAESCRSAAADARLLLGPIDAD